MVAAGMGSRLIGGAAWIALETWGHQATVLAIFLFIARLLGPEALGYAALAMAVPAIAGVLVTRGITDSLLQKSEVTPLHLDSAFWALALLGAALSILTYLLAEPISQLFGAPLLAALVGWTALILPVQALAAVPAVLLKRELRFRILAMRTLAGTVAGGIVGIGLALAGYGVWSIIFMQLAKATVELVILFARAKWRPRLRYSHSHFLELVPFAWPIVATSFVTIFNDEMPKLALGAFVGPAGTGVYALARKPFDVLSAAILAPLSGLTMPAVARLQKDPERVDRFYDLAVRAGSLIAFPAFVGFAAIAPEVVPLLFGEHWSQAIPAIQVLLLLGLIRAVDGICGGIVLALGHSSLLFALNLVYAALGLVFITTAARVSVPATMAAIIGCNLILLPVFLYYVRKLGSIDALRPLRIFPRLAVATGLMFIAVVSWLHLAPSATSPVVVTAAGISIGVAVYGVAAMLLLSRDVAQVRQLILQQRKS